MLLRVQKYNLTIAYVPGKLTQLADTLSRIFLKKNHKLPSDDLEDGVRVNEVLTQNDLSEEIRIHFDTTIRSAESYTTTVAHRTLRNGEQPVRDAVYWPRLNTDIGDCSICQEHQWATQEEPMMNHRFHRHSKMWPRIYSSSKVGTIHLCSISTADTST